MALNGEISRLAKLLIDAEGIDQAAAEARLRALTLEIVVGAGVDNVAGHSAILTAVASGVRSFVGGVSVRLAEDAALQSRLPLGASVQEAITVLGAQQLDHDPSARILIGEVGSGRAGDVHAWWDSWKAGASAAPRVCGDGDNPLAGIVAGAASVARAFAPASKRDYPLNSMFDLWPGSDGPPPAFGSVFLPGALWLLGLGNLGQAILWALAALPYPDPDAVKVVLQDRDQISPENWGTSVLVRSEVYGAYKTSVGEDWAKARGFDARRVDRWLDERQRVQDGDPVLAICGFDSAEARKHLDGCGFDAVIDAGLGRKHSDFDSYRVTIFDPQYSATAHFRDVAPRAEAPPQDYEALLGLDDCGAAEVHGVAVAAPFVSAIAGAVTVARAVAIVSGANVPRNEVRRLWRDEARTAQATRVTGRGILRLSQER
ncbi:MAG: hypothetical protein ACT4N8_06215 [Sphingosinicella sp.]|uniref:hypothetical protein n=1 Tax=Sphingosinicella sp. TaxID=1917971 RepID=UPI004037A8EB